MDILAVDTSTRSCSVGIVRDHEVAAEMTVDTGKTHSKAVLSLIDAVVQRSGLSLKAIQGYAVTRGPGSFTGIRIGLSVVKGLALVYQKPVFGISSLDALAFSCGAARNHVCALIDAGRHEVYCARYERAQGLLTKCTREAVVSPEAVIAEIAHPTLWIGSGALSYRKMIEEKHGESAFFPNPEDHIIRAFTVAFLAMAPMPELPSVENKDQGTHVLPHYIRDSDARLQVKAKP